MLVCDTAYTYEFLIDRGLTEFVTGKDVDGYFDHVWTVHAVASLLTLLTLGLRYGRPVVRNLNERHTHIEGKIGRFEILAWFPAFNFFSTTRLDMAAFKVDQTKSHNNYSGRGYLFQWAIGANPFC